jgi:hypothetical protein
LLKSKMNKSPQSTKLFIVALFIIALLMGYNYFARPFLRNYHLQSQEESNREELEAGEAFVQQKLSVLDTMSAQEKVGQLMVYPHLMGSDEATLSATAAANLVELNPGFVGVLGSGIKLEAVRQKLDSIIGIFSSNKVFPLLAVNHEGGVSQPLSGEGFESLPSWRELCALDQDLRREKLDQSARQLERAGIQIVFAPVLDINSQVLGSRSCANFEDLEEAAQDYVDIFGQNRMMSVVKHFPGLRNTTRDLRSTADTITLSDGDSRIFSQILSTYPNIGVMSSHVRLNNLLDGKPCSLSSDCLNAFPTDFPMALVFTDALDAGSLDIYGQSLVDGFSFLTLSQEQLEDNTDTAVLIVLSYEALLAGNDILTYSADVTHEQLMAVRNELAAQLDQDAELEDRVEIGAAKVLAVKRVDHE